MGNDRALRSVERERQKRTKREQGQCQVIEALLHVENQANLQDEALLSATSVLFFLQETSPKSACAHRKRMILQRRCC